MHKHITDILLDGFTRQSAKEGEMVDIIVRDVATSESPMFFVYAEQIANLIFLKLEVAPEKIDRYLMVLHIDNSADVYLQDFQTQIGARVSRTFSPGEMVLQSDLDSIEDVQFPGTSIVEGDRLVYLERRGWRFGIAFDFSRKTDQTEFSKLCAELQTKLLLENILQITLAELHKAGELGFDAFVITEGKTDWRHLERALREIAFKRKLRYDTSDQDRGDTKLLDICQSLALEPRHRPVVCVFDRDNETILKRLANADPEEKGYQDWGNNVYSFAIPVPEHRRNYLYISIEMYYLDDVLWRITTDGRRLCFDNEVKKELIQGKVTRAVIIPAVGDSEITKKVIANDVDIIEDEAGRKVCLSKARFAEMIRHKSEPFNEVDFSAFRLIAEQVERILNASNEKGIVSKT